MRRTAQAAARRQTAGGGECTGDRVGVKFCDVAIAGRHGEGLRVGVDLPRDLLHEVGRHRRRERICAKHSEPQYYGHIAFIQRQPKSAGVPRMGEADVAYFRLFF